MIDAETMIAELDRRHPAAADDVDAILAMPRSDAVNEGLLEASAAQHFNLSKGQPAQFVRNGVLETCQCRECAALRAVPSSDTVRVREALVKQALVAADGIHLLQDSMSLRRRTAEIIRELVAALSPSHCTAGRREEIARLIEPEAFIDLEREREWCKKYDKPAANWCQGLIAKCEIALKRADAILALTSEQSGSTAPKPK